MNYLGKNIRFLRQQQRWNLKELAIRLEISIPALSKIETGVTDINLSRLDQIATLFELTVVELLTLHEAVLQPENDELHNARLKLRNRETEIKGLQQKMIELFEELRTGTFT